MQELEVGESIGWNHGEAQVYRAVWNGRKAVLKRFARAKKYACEAYAYRVWSAQLPQVLHADPGRMELIFERIDAGCALHIPQTEVMYVEAGAALRRLHDGAPRGVPFDDGKLDLERQLLSFVPRARDVLDPTHVERVDVMMRDLLQNPWPPAVLRHGDYTARNWLWDGTRLTVIDPEHCRPGPAVLDVAKLHNDGFPAELQEAFQFGYGRPWTGQESALLRVGLGFQALTLGVWCHEHGDPAGVQAMGDALERLLG